MKQVNKKYQRKGMSLKFLTWIISIFVFIFSSTLVTSLVLLSIENNKLNQANTNYITIKDASNSVQMASDYLTDQVRLFVANADKKYMDSYFEEANVTKRREKALETIHHLSEQTSRHEEIHYNITKAVEESMNLMNVEYYAMKLTCVDKGISCDEYPSVANVDVSAVDPADRRNVALNSVLGDEYSQEKEKISNHINAAFAIIDKLMVENSRTASSNLRSLIVFQSVIIGANIVFIVVIVLTIVFLVIKPMDVAFHSIESNEEVHIYGNRELNYIVDAYNDVRSQNEKVKEKLTYEAEHDKLTNLYNRTGYVSLYRRMRLSSALYILIDVDRFKEINDEYGHDIGDKVLIRIAGVLEKNFSEDNAFIFRIGGDEFAVLIENVDDATENSIVERCENINKELSSPKGRIPASSLSIGIAHGEEDDTTDSLFKKADNVLYKVKQSGKSGVFYK
jgi:diguanylate cyclase (GGDEF)-like protein